MWESSFLASSNSPSTHLFLYLCYSMHSIRHQSTFRSRFKSSPTYLLSSILSLSSEFQKTDLYSHLIHDLIRRPAVHLKMSSMGHSSFSRCRTIPQCPEIIGLKAVSTCLMGQLQQGSYSFHRLFYLFLISGGRCPDCHFMFHIIVQQPKHNLQ